MQDNVRQQILNALMLVLRPLARALLRVGIGHREFAEVSKTAFVEIASKDYGLRGRPTNISRVAIMTGLTRKEVKRLRDKAETGKSISLKKLTPMGQVMHRWFTEPEYLDRMGNPAILDFDGEGITFSLLVKNFGGDIPPGAMRTELKRIGAIEEKEDGSLQAMTRSVVSKDGQEKLISGLAHVLFPAVLTMAHNTDPRTGDDTWVHLSASTQSIRKNDLPRIRRISRDRAAAFIESIDDFLAAYEALYESESSAVSDTAVGLGVFYFEEDKSETDIFK